MTRISIKEILAEKTLILGESGSGKTLMMAGLLEEAVSLGLADEITVIDMAPMQRGVGGKIMDYTGAVSKVRHLSDERIYAPRLMGVSREEVLFYAEQNAKISEVMLRQYEKSPTNMLMINDLTIFLQHGDPRLLDKCITMASTFIGSAYSGELLSDDKGSGISLREKILVDELVKRMDRVVELSVQKRIGSVIERFPSETEHRSIGGDE